MAEILIPFIVTVSVATLAIYLIMCIHDQRNPIKFWHTHKWTEVYHETVEGRDSADLYDIPSYYKALVIVNQCTICKHTRKTVNTIF